MDPRAVTNIKTFIWAQMSNLFSVESSVPVTMPGIQQVLNKEWRNKTGRTLDG